MHSDNLSRWTHDHVFDGGSAAAERGTRIVMAITAVMMVIEITAGWWFNSMALLADGWHMSSHAVAIGLSALAYSTARRYARGSALCFRHMEDRSTRRFRQCHLPAWCGGNDGGSSVERIVSPQVIQYQEASWSPSWGWASTSFALLILGRVASLIMVIVIVSSHGHGHGNGHEHAHGPDLQRQPSSPPRPSPQPWSSSRSQPEVGLPARHCRCGDLGARHRRLIRWLDIRLVAGSIPHGNRRRHPGSLWAKGLIAERERCCSIGKWIIPWSTRSARRVETGPDAGETRITDLHVWRVGKQAYSCALAVVTHDASLTPNDVRQRMRFTKRSCTRRSRSSSLSRGLRSLAWRVVRSAAVSDCWRSVAESLCQARRKACAPPVLSRGCRLD